MDEKPPKTYQIFEHKGQWKVTIPRVLAESLNLKKGDKVVWKIDRGELILRKA